MTMLKIKKLHADAIIPRIANCMDAGMDVCALTDPKHGMLIRPGDIKLVPTGIAMEIPFGFEIQVRPRGGLALKHGITVLNTPGTIDAGYRGEVGHHHQSWQGDVPHNQRDENCPVVPEARRD